MISEKIRFWLVLYNPILSHCRFVILLLTLLLEMTKCNVYNYYTHLLYKQFIYIHFLNKMY